MNPSPCTDVLNTNKYKSTASAVSVSVALESINKQGPHLAQNKASKKRPLEAD